MGPNVEMIISEGYRVVRGSIPARVRKELSQAVKSNELGHLKKDGLKPEIFFDIKCKALAEKAQSEIALDAVGRIQKIII